jgi:hypothetical protein
MISAIIFIYICSHCPGPCYSRSILCEVDFPLDLLTGPQARICYEAGRQLGFCDSRSNSQSELHVKYCDGSYKRVTANFPFDTDFYWKDGFTAYFYVFVSIESYECSVKGRHH